jgi:CheY-like chemotaxis protein
LQHSGLPGSPPAPDQPAHPMRVLLVEDEPITQMVTQECVESLGHQCVLAGDGNEALKLVQRQPVDAVITSYHMPGINGVELCRRIRHMRPEAPPYCILLTSLEYSEEARQATEDGIDAILTKPLDTSELSLHLQTSAVNLRNLS